jgi:hypothetical protein
MRAAARAVLTCLAVRPVALADLGPGCVGLAGGEQCVGFLERGVGLALVGAVNDRHGQELGSRVERGVVQDARRVRPSLLDRGGLAPHSVGHEPAALVVRDDLQRYPDPLGGDRRQELLVQVEVLALVARVRVSWSTGT